MDEAAPLLSVPAASRQRGGKQHAARWYWIAGVTAACCLVPYVAPSPWQHHPQRTTFCDSTYHESGYIKLPHKANDQYFYWFFESRASPTMDPLVLWLEGGPGTSSMWALLNENGPCFIGDDCNSTETNPHSWTNHANMIWLDQPTGVGFSYSGGHDDDHTEVDVGRNIYEFMQGFLDAHPSLRQNPFYIAGQSYGGHYVPAAAAYILEAEARAPPNASTRINLQGISIGNGLTDTVTQYPMLVEMAVENSYNITLVSPAELVQMQKDAVELTALVVKCQLPNQTQACEATDEFWDDKLLEPMIHNPTRNPYDFRQVCDGDCDDLGSAKTTRFLNQPWVKEHLHVRKPYSWSNNTVLDDFSVDEEKNAVHFVATVLARGLRVLIYAGDADLICDWKGNEAWTKKLSWAGHDAFNAADVTPLVVNGAVAGNVRTAHGLTFVRVFNSGHCVPRDQPVVSEALIHRFLQNELV